MYISYNNLIKIVFRNHVLTFTSIPSISKLRYSPPSSVRSISIYLSIINYCRYLAQIKSRASYHTHCPNPLCSSPWPPSVSHGMLLLCCDMYIDKEGLLLSPGSLLPFSRQMHQDGWVGRAVCRRTPEHRHFKVLPMQKADSNSALQATPDPFNPWP